MRVFAHNSATVCPVSIHTIFINSFSAQESHCGTEILKSVLAKSESSDNPSLENVSTDLAQFLFVYSQLSGQAVYERTYWIQDIQKNGKTDCTTR